MAGGGGGRIGNDRDVKDKTESAADPFESLNYVRAREGANNALVSQVGTTYTSERGGF